jgi:hypothetical protein
MLEWNGSGFVAHSTGVQVRMLLFRLPAELGYTWQHLRLFLSAALADTLSVRFLSGVSDCSARLG